MTKQEKKWIKIFLYIIMGQSLILTFGLNMLFNMTGWPMVAFLSFIASIFCHIIIDGGKRNESDD